jgi:hypothetical protein
MGIGLDFVKKIDKDWRDNVKPLNLDIDIDDEDIYDINVIDISTKKFREKFNI